MMCKLQAGQSNYKYSREAKNKTIGNILDAQIVQDIEKTDYGLEKTFMDALIQFHCRL